MSEKKIRDEAWKKMQILSTLILNLDEDTQLKKSIIISLILIDAKSKETSKSSHIKMNLVES